MQSGVRGASSRGGAPYEKKSGRAARYAILLWGVLVTRVSGRLLGMLERYDFGYFVKEMVFSEIKNIFSLKNFVSC